MAREVNFIIPDELEKDFDDLVRMTGSKDARQLIMKTFDLMRASIESIKEGSKVGALSQSTEITTFEEFDHDGLKHAEQLVSQFEPAQEEIRKNLERHDARLTPGSKLLQ